MSIEGKIAALRKDLEAFWPHASPDLMNELEAVVERHIARVEYFERNGKAHPKWIHCYGHRLRSFWKCSECGYDTTTERWMDHCPKCKAKFL